MTTAATLSTNEVAERLETDARTLRRFLRSESSPLETVGKGKRYVIDGKSFKLVQKAYAAWASNKGNAVTQVKDIPAQGKSKKA